MNIELTADDYFTITADGPQHSEEILVTPALATAWLARNKINRVLSEAHVDRFVWLIQNAKWTLTHLGPGFNREGRLIDGQHRLTAVGRAGIAVRMWVTFNIDASYGAPIDTCVLPRRVHDVLLLSQREVAICHALMELEGGTKARGTPEKVAATRDEHRTGIDWAMRAFPFQRGITAALQAAHAFAYPAAPREVAAFAKQFLAHTAASTEEPAVALHRYLERSSRARIKGREVSLVALRCLEAHCKKKALSRLSVTDSGLAYFVERRGAKRAEGGVTR